MKCDICDTDITKRGTILIDKNQYLNGLCYMHAYHYAIKRGWIPYKSWGGVIKEEDEE